MTDTLEAPSNGYVPGEIPQSDERPPPSVWAAGDVHHTHDQVWDESPAGVQAANTPDPRDAEIMRLNAIIAGGKEGVTDPRDLEIARLKAQIEGTDGPKLAPDAPIEVEATVIDPRDAEIEALKAELADKG